MSMSFIKGLTASILSNFSSIKRQVKRLQKESERLVGRKLAVEECQEIVAAINGYRRWADISEISVRTGVDRSAPPYTILSRSDAHEKVLSVLVDFDLELDESKPLVFLGDLKYSATPAYCMWAETISARRVPGLILVETEQETLQDTALWQAIESLGLQETASQFRVIDAREKVLQVAITATPRGWVGAFASTLQPSQREEFSKAGTWHLLERLVSAYAKTSGWGASGRDDVPSSALARGLFFLGHHKLLKTALLSELKGDERVSMQIDIEEYASQVPLSLLEVTQDLYDLMDSSTIGMGPLIWAESEHRPTVVLFNRSSRLSEVIAGAVHECYYWRFANSRTIRPILYFSDCQEKRCPELLSFASNSVVCNGVSDKASGIWSGTEMKSAMFCTADVGHLIFSGQKGII
ncbi:TPA: hypothetical protein ACKRQV_001290 [Pseudomonas aeruginosa]